MKINLKQTFLLCGLAVMLAAFPVFGQEKAKPEIRLNKKPLNDLVDFVRDKFEKDKIDFNKPFAVEMKGVLNKDGKLDADKSSYVRAEGDEQMVEIAKRTIEAINDTGYFQFLKNLGSENITISLSQDAQEFSAIIKSDSESERKTRMIISALGTLIKMIPMQENLSADDRTIWNSIIVKNDGKEFVLNATLPKAVWYEMINRKLIEQKVARQTEIQRINE